MWLPALSCVKIMTEANTRAAQSARLCQFSWVEIRKRKWKVSVRVITHRWTVLGLDVWRMTSSEVVALRRHSFSITFSSFLLRLRVHLLYSLWTFPLVHARYITLSIASFYLVHHLQEHLVKWSNRLIFEYVLYKQVTNLCSLIGATITTHTVWMNDISASWL